MFDKRLFQLAPGLKKLIAGKVALMWVGLFANIGFMLSLVMLLNSLLTAVAPPLLQCGGTSQGVACPVPLSDQHGADVLPMAGDVMIYVLLALVCIAVRYTATTHATRLGTEAAERVKLALRSKLYRKMVALGPSYKTRIKTSDVVQSAGEGVEQIQSFFELFLPQFFYAILAPITLFVAIAPINVPAAAVMLVCAPLIIIVTGIVSMTAARAFKKYWVRYTDMGAAFLDNLQGLETLKNFDADERAAIEMDKKAEGFRVMTMRVLQIQLRSLTAMDIVAYGGAAAGIGVALWQYAHIGDAFANGASGWSPIALASHLPGVLAYAAYGLHYLIPFGVGYPLSLQLYCSFVTVFKIVFFGLFVVVAFLNFDSANFLPLMPDGKGLESIPLAATSTLWAFVGLESATVTAGEISNPEKNVRKSTIYGMIISAIIYILISVASMGAMPNGELATSSAPLTDILTNILGSAIGKPLAISVVICILGTTIGWLLSTARVAYAAGEDGVFPKVFGKLHPKYSTPSHALIIGSILVNILLIMNYQKSMVSAFTFITILATLAFLPVYLLTACAEIMLMFKGEKEITLKIFFKKSFVPLLAFIYTIWTIYGSGAEIVMWGFILMLLGVPFYIYNYHKNK